MICPSLRTEILHQRNHSNKCSQQQVTKRCNHIGQLLIAGRYLQQRAFVRYDNIRSVNLA